MLRNSEINSILPSTTLVSESNWPEQSEVAAVPFPNQVVTPRQRQQGAGAVFVLSLSQLKCSSEQACSISLIASAFLILFFVVSQNGIVVTVSVL